MHICHSASLLIYVSQAKDNRDRPLVSSGFFQLALLTLDEVLKTSPVFVRTLARTLSCTPWLSFELTANVTHESIDRFVGLSHALAYLPFGLSDLKFQQGAAGGLDHIP